MAVVPWEGWSEWERAYLLLFSLDSRSEREEGVRLVSTWALRARLPVAIDATAALTQANLHDTAGTLAEGALCLLYAGAVVRMVNGLVDPFQQGQRALSIHAIARELSLPAALVDLRHECTHNRLPSLSAFRLLAEQALLWLHQHYWLAQRHAATAPPSPLPSLLRYAKANVEKCSRGANPSKQEIGALAADLEGWLNQLQLRSRLMASMLDEGFLAPSRNTSPLSPPIDGGSHTPSFGVEGTTERLHAIPPLPESAFEPALQARLWQPVLVRLQRRKPSLPLGSALLLECSLRLSAEGGVPSNNPRTKRLESIRQWGLQILSQSSGPDALLAVDPHSLHHAVFTAAKAPNGWGIPLVARAIERADFPPHLRSELTKLLEIRARADRVQSQRADASGGEKESNCLIAAEWASKLEALPELELPLKPLKLGSPWSICTRWAPIPIGMTPARPHDKHVFDGTCVGKEDQQRWSNVDHPADEFVRRCDLSAGSDEESIQTAGRETAGICSTEKTESSSSVSTSNRLHVRLLVPPYSVGASVDDASPSERTRPQPPAKRRRGATC